MKSVPKVPVVLSATTFEPSELIEYGKIEDITRSSSVNITQTNDGTGAYS